MSNSALNSSARGSPLVPLDANAVGRYPPVPDFLLIYTPPTIIWIIAFRRFHWLPRPELVTTELPHAAEQAFRRAQTTEGDLHSKQSTRSFRLRDHSGTRSLSSSRSSSGERSTTGI